MQITTVSFGNFRGQSGEYDLGQRTFITGPNGSGKSTIVCAAYFAIMGRLPGYKVSQMVENASADDMWAKVKIDGRTIERHVLQTAKGVSTTVRIDGEKIGSKDAEATIRLMLGSGPALLDMPAFWDCSATDKRKMILKLTAAELDGKDEKIKAERNAKLAEKHALEKVLAELVATHAQKTRPIGSAPKMEAEVSELDAEINNLTAVIATGEANERTKKLYDERIAAKPEIEERLALCTIERDAYAADIDRNTARISALEKKEREAKEPEGVSDRISTESEIIIQRVIIAAQSRSRACGKCGLLHDIQEVLPSHENIPAWNQWVLAKRDREMELAALEDMLSQNEESLRIIEHKKTELERDLADSDAAAKMQADIGPGVDPESRAMLLGLEDRRTKIRATLKELIAWNEAEAAIEKHRARVNECSDEVAVFGEKLAEAKAAQAEGIKEIEDTLAKRSASILSEGRLRITDDGKDMAITWEREGRPEVSRNTLSGGEQQLFDVALGHALAPEAVICLEAGEVDAENLERLAHKLADVDCQIVLASWFDPWVDMPAGWKKVEL